MIAEIFPIFSAWDITSFTIRRDYCRYVVCHIQRAGKVCIRS